MLTVASTGVITATQGMATLPSVVGSFYETGSWTPDQGAGLTGTIATSTGAYTKVGRQVTVAIQYTGTGLTAASANSILCTNLPYTAVGVAMVGGVFTPANSVQTAYVNAASKQIYNIPAIASCTTIFITLTYFI